MSIKTNIEALRDTMAEEMRRDPSIIITGEDVGQRGGVFRATEGLYAEFGPSRVIDSPLSELSIVGVGIGMALNGIRPICEIQFADFIFPAFNQIVSEAAKMRYRSNSQFTVPMVIRAPYGGGISGALYHSQSIEAFFAHVPGLRGRAQHALRHRRPPAHRAAQPGPGALPGAQEAVPVDQGGGARRALLRPHWQGHVARPGDDLTVISYGLMLHESLKAAAALAGEGSPRR